MRFETDVLTSLHQRLFFHGPGIQYGNYACSREIEARGWVLPESGGSVVLVFSTKRIKGASTCKRRHLIWAGGIAYERIPERIPSDTTLYWWPEVVTYE